MSDNPNRCGVCGIGYPVIGLAEDCEVRHLGKIHPDRRVVSIHRRRKMATPPRPPARDAPILPLVVRTMGSGREILSVAMAQYELETVATLMSGVAKLLEGT